MNVATQPNSMSRLKPYLDSLVHEFEKPEYIQFDPIAIPHGFDGPRDREVIGLFAALLSWGRRETVLAKMEDLCERMRYRPFRFVRDFDAPRDADMLKGFQHRTFKPVDAVWLTQNLGRLLRRHGTVESLFVRHMRAATPEIGAAIQGFSQSILDEDPATPRRLGKHLARPLSGSACKRLNMYVRWMVRPGPFDLGIWSRIRTDQLVLPLDVHSGRQARELGLLHRRSTDWRAALELTEACRILDPHDPCRYDLALFGRGAYASRLSSIDLDTWPDASTARPSE